MATQLYRPKINYTPPKNEQKTKADEPTKESKKQEMTPLVSYSITPFLKPTSIFKDKSETTGERKHYPQPTDRPVDKKANPVQMKFSKKTETYTTDGAFADKSTAIKQVKYNPETEDLKVKFKGGKNKEYWFPEVPEDVVKQWANKNTTSKGKFYWDQIRPFSIYYPRTGRSLSKSQQKSSIKLMKNLIKNDR